MHKDLELAFHKVIEILKVDERCKGGWHYGSISRGDEDMCSRGEETASGIIFYKGGF